MSKHVNTLRPSIDWVINWRLVSIGAVLVIWQLFAMNADPRVFPGIVETASALWTVFSGASDYGPATHIPLTLLRVAIAFIATMTIGVPIGILMGINDFTEDYLSVWALILLTFPAVVWAFLGVLWFGFTTLLVPVFVATMTCIPFAIFNSWEGMKDVDQGILEMADSFRVSRSRLWRDVFVPNLLPYVFASMRMVVSVGWKVMLVAEIFGSQAGVGYVINEMFLLQRNDMIIVWALPPMLLIFLFERGLKRTEDRLFEWRPEVRTQTSYGE